MNIEFGAMFSFFQITEIILKNAISCQRDFLEFTLFGIIIH